MNVDQLLRFDNPIDALVTSLVQRFDRNSDGQLSTEKLFATMVFTTVTWTRKWPMPWAK